MKRASRTKDLLPLLLGLLLLLLADRHGLRLCNLHRNVIILVCLVTRLTPNLSAGCCIRVANELRSQYSKGSSVCC